MLSPSKHTDLSLSMLNVAGQALKEVRQARVIRYDDLAKKIERRLGPDSRYVFTEALSFLFLIGRLNYLEKNDMFEYVESKAQV